MNGLGLGGRISCSGWSRYLSGLALAGLLLLGLAAPVAAAMPAAQRAAKPVVHAIFFYSTDCTYCETVMREFFPPLADQYGRQLQILMVDVNGPSGKALYQAAIKQFKIPYDRWGVPTLIVGDAVLVGADEIPGQFPGLIQTHLAQGGVAWPELAGLPEMVASVPAWSAQAEAASLSLADKLARDPVGNGLSILVLAGMLLAAGYTAATLRPRSAARRVGKRPAAPSPVLPAWRSWAVLALALAGMGIAGYLTYVEVSRVSAVWGPVGDCNLVQQSSYSRLFNVVPVGALGLAGYGLIAAAWLTGRLAGGRVAEQGALVLFGLAALGTLFSIYLTFLEPFVIGAACAWCLASAAIMTALLWLTAAPVKRILFNRG